MSRWNAAIAPALALGLLGSAPAAAQDAYGPPDIAVDNDSDEKVPLVEEQPCDETTSDEGTILVCRELPDSERYMSPLPRPVQSDRAIIPGLTDPPCWVSNPTGGVCIRMGWAPPPAYMIDFDALPTPLSAEDAALVFAVPPAGEDLAAQEPHRVTGERVPIDIAD